MKLFSGKMLETLLIEQRRYSEGLLPEIIKHLATKISRSVNLDKAFFNAS